MVLPHITRMVSKYRHCHCLNRRLRSRPARHHALSRSLLCRRSVGIKASHTSFLAVGRRNFVGADTAVVQWRDLLEFVSAATRNGKLLSREVVAAVIGPWEMLVVAEGFCIQRECLGIQPAISSTAVSLIRTKFGHSSVLRNQVTCHLTTLLMV
jgi:hypothetical protein